MLTGSFRVTLLRIRDSYNQDQSNFGGSAYLKYLGVELAVEDEFGLHLSRQSSNRRLCNGFHTIR